MPTPPVVNGLQAAAIVGGGVALCYMFISKGVTGKFNPLPAVVAGSCAFLVALWLFQ